MQASISSWELALASYPDRHFVEQLVGTIHRGTHIAYSGPLRHQSHFISVKNLPMTTAGRAHVQSKIASCLQEGRLVEVDPAPLALVCSPVGTVPKPRSTRLRTIHHLSHPCKPRPDQLPLVNDGISPSSPPFFLPQRLRSCLSFRTIKVVVFGKAT